MGNCLSGKPLVESVHAPAKAAEVQQGGSATRAPSAGRDAPADAGGGGLRKIKMTEVSVSVPQRKLVDSASRAEYPSSRLRFQSHR